MVFAGTKYILVELHIKCSMCLYEILIQDQKINNLHFISLIPQINMYDYGILHCFFLCAK